MSTDERGLKTPRQVAYGWLAVFAVPILIFVIGSWLKARPFGDAALIGRFGEHRAAFEQLARLAMAEPNGFNESSSEDNPARPKYYALMQGAGISLIVKEMDGKVSMEAALRWDGFLSVDRQSKGFVFSKKVPQTRLNSLDGVDVANGNTAYRQIDKNWYLYLTRDNFDMED